MSPGENYTMSPTLVGRRLLSVIKIIQGKHRKEKGYVCYQHTIIVVEHVHGIANDTQRCDLSQIPIIHSSSIEEENMSRRLRLLFGNT